MESKVLNKTLVNVMGRIEYSFYDAKRNFISSITNVLIDLCNEQPHAKMISFDLDNEIITNEFDNGYTAVTAILVQKDDEGDDILKYETTTCYSDKDDTNVSIINGFLLSVDTIIAVWDSIKEMYGFDAD